MPDEARPSVRGRRLGAELRRLRSVAGKTTEDAANALRCSRAKISRIETGVSGIRQLDLSVLLDLYDITEPEYRGTLEALAQGSKKQDWWEAYRDIVAPTYIDYMVLESDARHIHHWATTLIPGLLQTEAYARAVLEAVPAVVDAERVGQLVKIRMERQVLLTRTDPPRLQAILWEPIVRCPVGGREAWRAQLGRIIDLARLPHVTVQIVPLTAGVTAGASGPFTTISFTDSPSPAAVYLETMTSSHYFIESDSELGGYGPVFESLKESALSPEGSLELIQVIAAEA
ncbi:helix-turn-helix domain-containing protein [Kitasatospora sp. NPDC058218]|uniref:helix-turn-helix domain-containing protein n=1 Tax=Kitasatospora sp. NPDC058218 TaxID=3346385 RepID=UPI0036DF017E